MSVVNENQIIVVDVPGGFTGSISFLSNTLESPSGGYAYVYDGPSGTGNVLRCSSNAMTTSFLRQVLGLFGFISV